MSFVRNTRLINEQRSENSAKVLLKNGMCALFRRSGKEKR